jgi:hypothetical protein
MQYRVTWGAAVWAGVAAGILATVAQIALWSIFADLVPAILFRDTRFTAAIVMGRAVLLPPATFDAGIMLAAALVHFALSIIYGLGVSWVITRLRVAPPMRWSPIRTRGLRGKHVRLHRCFSLVRSHPRLDNDCRAPGVWYRGRRHLPDAVAGQYVHAQSAMSKR